MLATDHAWHEGLPQWVPLNEIAGVISNQAATSSPPPFNPSVAAAPEKVGRKKLLIFGSIGVAALVTVVLVMVMGGKTSWVSDPSDPNNVTIENAIRTTLVKPAGKLTKADLEQVTVLLGLGNPLTEVPKELEKLTQLKVLALGNSKLTDVKGLENLTQLEELHLHRNQLTDVKGLEKLTKLKILDLDHNQLTDVKGLENLTQLKELDLASNPALTKAQIAELQKVLPNCEIFSNPTK